MNKKTKIYLLTGTVIVIIGVFEWIISPLVFPEIPALTPWISFIVFLIGIYFYERAWNERKIERGEKTREQIKKEEMTWKQWALIYIGFVISVIVIAFIILIAIG